MSLELDALDNIAAKAYEGVVVRKDLIRRFKGQYPVPTYVAEFLLGRYCATVDEDEIQEGLKIVERQLAEKPSEPASRSCSRRERKSKARLRSSMSLLLGSMRTRIRLLLFYPAFN